MAAPLVVGAPATRRRHRPSLSSRRFPLPRRPRRRVPRERGGDVSGTAGVTGSLDALIWAGKTFSDPSLQR